MVIMQENNNYGKGLLDQSVTLKVVRKVIRFWMYSEKELADTGGDEIQERGREA